MHDLGTKGQFKLQEGAFDGDLQGPVRDCHENMTPANSEKLDQIEQKLEKANITHRNFVNHRKISLLSKLKVN